MEKYIFRFDKSYPDEGKHQSILEQHDGQECYADIPARYGLLSTVPIEFIDGYKTVAFVYELEMVSV